jgi:large-conductance mechanosensitive channel
MHMEKQLSVAAYWAGIISTVIAIIARGLAATGLFVSASSVGKVVISYHTFLIGAELFFLMAIAGSVITWVNAPKP